MLEVILTLLVAAPVLALAKGALYPALGQEFPVSYTESEYFTFHTREVPPPRVFGQDSTPELTANFRLLLQAGYRIRQGRFGLYYLYRPHRLPQLIPADVPERLVARYARMSEQYDITGVA